MVIGEKMTSHDWQQSRAIKSETKSSYSPITVEPEKGEPILNLQVMVNKTFPNRNLDDATKYFVSIQFFRGHTDIFQSP